MPRPIENKNANTLNTVTGKNRLEIVKINPSTKNIGSNPLVVERIDKCNELIMTVYKYCVQISLIYYRLQPIQGYEWQLPTS